MRLIVWLTAVIVLIATAMLGATPKVTTATKASDLRRALNVLLTEHVYLATNATGAALSERDADFSAAAWALDANSVELSAAIASIYGKKAGDKFLEGWRKHIRFFVDYTKGVATKDRGKRNKAVADLHEYAKELGVFLHSANPNLLEAAVASLIREHVAALTRAIDQQGAGKQVDAYKAVRAAGKHSHTIADPIAEAIVTQFPAKFR